MLHRYLDSLLAERKKTRYWLARQTGLSEKSLRRFSRGETTGIDFVTLEKICYTLQCQPGDLLVYTPEANALEQRDKE